MLSPKVCDEAFSWVALHFRIPQKALLSISWWLANQTKLAMISS
jgi:hypothetical protein